MKRIFKSAGVVLYLSVIYIAVPLPGSCQLKDKVDSAEKFSFNSPIKQKPFHFITNVPADILQIIKSPFQKSNLKGFGATIVLTGLLLPLDQPITNSVKHLSGQLNFHSETDYKILLKFGNTKILKIPNNLNSALYQLGEGGTSMMLAGGLLLYGKIVHNKRDVSAASDLAETFITMGITTQIIKRISGRQSPFMSTDEGGVWKPLPSFKKFQQNTPEYDAFPSGHLATMTATVCTLLMDYPEKKWISPVGFTIIGLTGMAMINTDVHWMSDYPLAMALGYISARITHKRNHPMITQVISPITF